MVGPGKLYLQDALERRAKIADEESWRRTENRLSGTYVVPKRSRGGPFLFNLLINNRKISIARLDPWLCTMMMARGPARGRA